MKDIDDRLPYKSSTKVLGHLIILIIGVIFDLATLGRLLEKIDNFIIQYLVTQALTFKGMYQRNVHCIV